MTMRGLAFLPIWHDVDDEAELEFNRWHTVEHMPERLATPGIVVGRRYANPGSSRLRYFTLYEAMSFEVFESEGYFATANARSEWTQSVHPHFQNFLRSPCHLVMTRGRGLGGALATVRVIFKADAERTTEAIGPKDRFTLAVRPLVERTMAIDLVTSVHAGVTAPVARKPLSAQSLSLRPNATAFNGVLMVEAIGRDALHAAMPGIEAILQVELSDFAGWEIDEYDLAYVITSTEG
jgi:hypothetical protein